MNKKLVGLLAGIVALAAASLPAKAVDFAYTGAFSSTPNGNGLLYSATFNQTAFSIPVPPGAPLVVDDLMTISSLNTNLFGTVADTISATFNFTSPGVAGGSVGGTGTETTFLGFVTNGLIDWSGPANINFGGGNFLLVTLEDTPYGIHDHHVGIDATFAISGPFAVPGPIVGAGLPGLVSALFGMLGFNYFRRRRNLATA